MDERTKQLLTLGREHYEKREFEKAEPYLRQALERPERFADVHNMLGVICHDAGRLSEAQAMFEEALAYNDLGRYDEAKKIYQAALAKGAESPGKLDPFVKGKIANLHAEVAQAYVDVGLIPDAKHELRKAVLLCPTFADLRLRLANLYRQSGDLDAAKFELEEAVSTRPRYVPAWIALGVTMLAKGDSAAAVKAWEQALAIEPDHKAAQMYLRMVRTSPG
jgi:tetratricopeptide (TPR) repeat protein